MTRKQTVSVGDTFHTNNYGECVVTHYETSKKVKIKFVTTGYETMSSVHNLRSGQVKDLLAPKHYNIGYIGEGIYLADDPAYSVWADMLKRCYSPKYHAKQPTYKDCTVCDEWHNFQTFAAWYHENIPQQKVALDKDAAIKGNKEYAPHTCTFLTHADNAEVSLAKKWVFLTPSKDQIEIYNLNKFCKNNGLDSSAMSKVYKGILKKHKGWTKPT